MNKENLIKLRTLSIICFSFGALAFVITMFLAGNFLFLLAGLVSFSGMSCFLFTEAFLYSSETRSIFNIWMARLFFFLSLPIQLGILYALVSLI